MTPRRSPSPKPPETAIPDILGPDLRVLFCGINPGRVSAAARAHFANPRNDFWRLLHAAGSPPRHQSVQVFLRTTFDDLSSDLAQASLQLVFLAYQLWNRAQVAQNR